MKPPVGLLFLSVLGLGACTPPDAGIRTPVRSVRRTTPTSPADRSPFIRIPDWYRLFDPTAWYAAKVQERPAGFIAIAESIQEVPYPGASVAKVMAFDVGLEPAGISETRRIGRDCSVVAADGTLCPQLIEPGSVLSPEHVDRLLSVIRAPETLATGSSRRKTCLCAIFPASAFVFYDDGKRPIAYVLLSRDRTTWSLAPRLNREDETVLTTSPRERALLGRLCAELNLECRPNETENSAEPTPVAGSSKRFARHLLPLLLEPPPHLSLGRPLSQADESERRMLCAWNSRALADSTQALTGFAWSHNPGATLSFGDPRWSLGFHNFNDCLSKFPECEGTIGAALKTLSVIYQSIAEERAVPERPSDCVFGIEVHPAVTVEHTTPVTATGKTQMPGNVTGQP